MDFNSYAEHQRKEMHKDIIEAICIEINNCADCINDECRRTECFPLSRVELFKVTANSFYIETYDNSRINRKLLELAEEYDYNAGLIEENGIVSIKYWK